MNDASRSFKLLFEFIKRTKLNHAIKGQNRKKDNKKFQKLLICYIWGGDGQSIIAFMSAIWSMANSLQILSMQLERILYTNRNNFPTEKFKTKCNLSCLSKHEPVCYTIQTIAKNFYAINNSHHSPMLTGQRPLKSRKVQSTPGSIRNRKIYEIILW